MSPRFRPPERRFAHPIGVLAIALGISLIVFATFSSRPGEETDDDLGQAATATSETVLGAVIERTTLPDAAPAEPAGFTTTSTGSALDDQEPTVNPGTVPHGPGSSPTTASPVPTTRPSTTTTTVRHTTTSTTRPTTTTTQATTTTTEPTTTTTETPP